MSTTLDNVVKTANEYKFIRIIPATNLDSLIAASILSKNLTEHGIEAPVNLDPKSALEEEKTPTVFIDLPRLDKNSNYFELRYDGKNSITAHVTYYIDRVFGATRWDKVLAVIAGIYRGLDRGREGFTGLERELLDELTKTKQVSIDLGLRLWGWKKYSLPKTLYRTLIPFIPGFSGDPERTVNILKNVLGIENPDTVMGEHILSFTEEGLDKTKVFLEKISENMKHVDIQTRNKILISMLGFVYLMEYNNQSIDLLEAIGALDIFLSLDDDKPYYILLISRDDLVFSTTLLYYEELIDELCVETATFTLQYLKSKHVIFESNTLKRPELYIDILKSIDMLPKEKPVLIRRDGLYFTSLSEIIRLGEKPSSAYNLCNEYQLCMVNENGVLIKT